MSTPRARDTLSRTLRDLRKAAGLTGAEVAERTGFSPAKVSRYENGRLVPPPEAAEAYAIAVGASATERQHVVALANDVRESFESRLVLIRDGSGGAVRIQDRIRRIEASSGHIGTFSNTLVPGLMQIPDYAKIVFESAELSADEVAQAVAGRLRRQVQAREGGRRYTQVFTEGVLTWHVGGPDLMARQCEHLAALARAGDDSFQVGVIPMARAGDQFPLEAFDYYDDRAVLMGTFTATAFMTQRGDVDGYGGLFRRMTEQADYGEAAAGLIDRYTDTYRKLADRSSQ